MKVRGAGEGGASLICGREGTQNGGNVHRHRFKTAIVKVFFPQKPWKSVYHRSIFIAASHSLHQRNVFLKGGGGGGGGGGEAM